MYLDLLIILNFFVDLFLILGTGSLSGVSLTPGGVILASLLGAAYSGGCMLKGFHFLGQIHWRIVSLMLMSVLAFGWNRLTLKCGSIFLVLSFSLGGLSELLYKNNFWSIPLASLGLFFLSKAASKCGTEGQKFIPIEINHGMESLRMIALKDTGNVLRDPITGERVLIIGEQEACKLTGLTQKELKEPLDTISRCVMPGLRLIPYRAVGKDNGLMLAMRFPDVKFNGKKRSAIVAFSPCGLGGNVYQALTGGIA